MIYLQSASPINSEMVNGGKNRVVQKFEYLWNDHGLFGKIENIFLNFSSTFCW